MAGDWIKMRMDLRTHPKVVRISSATGSDKLRVVGGLHAVWCLFDIHSTDGHIEGYTVAAIDEYLGFPGFADAMALVGWLEIVEGGLKLPEFDTHNGTTAKRRAEDAVRKAASRRAKSVLDVSADDADEMTTREEKRREQENKANTEDVATENDVPIPLPEPPPEPPEPPPAKPKRERKPRPAFVKPTIEEVAAYCQERGGIVDPQRWYDHYTANGWMVGKSPMQDWKAAVRNWEGNKQYRSTGPPIGRMDRDQSLLNEINEARSRAAHATGGIGSNGAHGSERIDHAATPLG